MSRHDLSQLLLEVSIKRKHQIYLPFMLAFFPLTAYDVTVIDSDYDQDER